MSLREAIAKLRALVARKRSAKTPLCIAGTRAEVDERLKDLPDDPHRLVIVFGPEHIPRPAPCPRPQPAGDSP